MAISIIPADAPLGAEIRGVNIAEDLTDEVMDQIRGALDDRAVVYFRKQYLSPGQQAAFSHRLGPAMPYNPQGAYRDAEFPEVLVLSNIYDGDKPIGLIEAGQYWHTDNSFGAEPPSYGIVQAVEIPRDEAGKSVGETVFVSSAYAYETLPEDIKKRILPLRARHNAKKIKRSENRQKYPGEYDSGKGLVDHPVVRTHLRTGKKCLYVNETYAESLIGVEENEGRELLNYLCRHVIDQKARYTHYWDDGDLLIWDDCLEQHFATPNYGLHQRRRVHRTSVAGSRPV